MQYVRDIRLPWHSKTQCCLNHDTVRAGYSQPMNKTPVSHTGSHALPQYILQSCAIVQIQPASISQAHLLEDHHAVRVGHSQAIDELLVCHALPVLGQ